MILNIFIFKDDLFEGNETKKKLFEQTTPAHMREMLSSHYKLATVSSIKLLLFYFNRKSMNQYNLE
jgi:hypothetical protein